MSFIYENLIKFIDCVIAVCFSVLFGFLLARFIRCRYGKKRILGDSDLLLVKPSKQIQHFSLPNPIIRYVAMNPTTPNCYKKLIRSCKYFPTKNPIIIVSELPFIPLFFWGLHFSKPKPPGNRVMENIEDVKSWEKIWITTTICSLSVPVSAIILKLHKCEIRKLILKKQNMSFDEFLILTPNVEKLIFKNVVIKYCSGKTVMFEDIVKNLPALETIIYKSNSHDISKHSVEKLLNIPHLTNLCKFVLKEIPESFDFAKFSKYITDNCKSTQLVLDFNDPLSDVYKQNILDFITKFDPTEDGVKDFYYPLIMYEDNIWGNENDAIDWDESDDE